MMRLLHWLLDWFRPSLKDGSVVKKYIVTDEVPHPMFIGGVPFPPPGGSAVTRRVIVFEKGYRRRTVYVNKECFDRYRVGDAIKFGD